MIDSSSVNRYHSLVEENPYENVSMDSQAMEASDYANEGACASTTDDLIDKQVVAEKPFKSTEDVFPLMTRLQDDSKVEIPRTQLPTNPLL